MDTHPITWYPWRIRRLLKNMLEQLRDEKDHKKEPYHLTLGGLCADFDVHRQRLNEWEKEYPDDFEITEPMKMIKQILETRINEGALKGQLAVAPAIFNLKNNYGWRDERHITDERIIEQTEEIRQIREGLAARRREIMGNSIAP